MSREPEFSDAQLIQYLDATAPESLALQIQDAVANDPDLAGRLSEMSLDTKQLRSTFDQALKGAPPMDLDTLVSAAGVTAGADAGSHPHAPASHLSRWLPMAASVVLAAGIGLLAGQHWNRSGVISPDWQTAVIQYHDLYAVDTLPEGQPDDTELEQQLSRVSANGGLPVSAGMVKLPGLQFMRAQTLSHRGDVLIQLAFLSDQGKPVVLCFMRTGQGGAKAVAQSVDGMDTISWSNNGYSFILAGKQSADLLNLALPAARANF